jgi:RNA polymerase sigma factor (sigma-70 family)
MYADLTDRELICILMGEHGGDATRAWQEWDRRHGARAEAVAIRILKRGQVPLDRADDALQQGTLQFLSHLDFLDENRPPLPYFLTTIRHATQDVVRREKVRRVSDRPVIPAPAGPDEVIVLRDTIDHLLKTLSPDKRDLLEAHYLEGRSVREIAAERGIPVEQVYRQLHQARCRVREQCQER